MSGREGEDLRPVWLLDVDGVLNIDEPSWGAELTEGYARDDDRGYEMRWVAPAIDRVRALAKAGTVDIRWCTTWCAWAEELEQLWDLPQLGRAFLDKVNGRVAMLAKQAAARQVRQGGRRLIWTDDDVTPVAGRLFEELTAGRQALLIQPDFRIGLQPEHFDLIEAFVSRQTV